MANDIFLLVTNDDYSDVTTEVKEFPTLDELNLVLADESFNNLEEENMKVYHGVTVPATFIPDSFKGSTPYIIISNPLGQTDEMYKNEAHFEKSSGDAAVVALTIQELLKEKNYNFSANDHLVTINHVRIFFGHELTKVFYIPEDHIDEELIDRVTKLADTITETNSYLERKFYEKTS